MKYTICGMEISKADADRITGACNRISFGLEAHLKNERKQSIITGFNNFGRHNPHNLFKGTGAEYYEKHF